MKSYIFKLLKAKLLLAVLLVSTFAFAQKTDYTNCLGEKLSISSTETKGSSYNWSITREGKSTSDYTFVDAGGKAQSETIQFSSAGTYTITITYLDGDGKSQTETITVLVENCCLWPVGINLSATEVCQGGLLNISGANAGDNKVYSWNFDGGASGTNTGLGPHFVSWSTPGTKNVCVTVSDACGCKKCPDTTFCVKVNVKPLPNVSITPPSGCTYVNTNLNFNASAAVGSTFSWYTGASGSIVSGQGTSSVTTTFNSTGVKQVCVVATLNGCTEEECINVNVINTSCPNALITGPIIICQNTTANYMAANQGFGVNYTWDFGSGAYNISGTSTNKSVKYSTTGNKQIRLIVSKCGCPNDTFILDITVKPTPVTNLTGPSCGSTGTTYTFTTPTNPTLTGTTYTWTTGDASGSSSTNSIDLSWNTTGNKTVCVTAAYNGCSSNSCKTVSIVSPGCPNAEFYPDAMYCQNESFDIMAVDQGFGTNYTWYLEDKYGWGTPAGTGQVLWASQWDTGYLKVRLIVSKCGCPNDTLEKTVYFKPAPIANISGSTFGYINTNYTFTTPTQAGSTYTWTQEGVVQSETTNNITRQWSTLGYKTLCVVVNNGCEASDCHTIGIIDNTCPQAIINGPTSACQGETVKFTAEDQGCLVDYTWFINNVELGNGLVFNPTFNSPGTYQVKLIVNPCGCNSCTPDTATVNITINPTPIADVTGLSVGVIDTVYTFTTPLVSGATYSWTVSGGQIQGSSTGNSINVKWSTPGYKNVCVTVTLATCSKVDCHGINITGTPAPCTYPSKFQFSKFTLFSNLDGLAQFDGGNSRDTIIILNPNGVILTSRTDTIYERTINPHTDTTAYISTNFTPNATTCIWNKFNHSLNQVKFSIYDLDYDSINSSKYLAEYVKVDAYFGGNIINLTPADYTLGSFVEFTNNNTFRNITGSVPANSTFGDINFAFGSAVDSFKVCFNPKIEGGFNSLIPDFGISDIEHCSSVPLPVKWLDIKAVRITENSSIVTWKTASEIQNDRFEIEKSTNGSDFVNIGTVKGSGTTNMINSYKFIDNNAIGNSIVYRIKQIDLDGKYSYSDIAILLTKSVSRNVYPNPTQNVINVESNIEITKNTEMKITDLAGKVLVTKVLDTDTYLYTINVSDLPNGIYFVTYVTKGNAQVHKFVISR